MHAEHIKIVPFWGVRVSAGVKKKHITDIRSQHKVSQRNPRNLQCKSHPKALS